MGYRIDYGSWDQSVVYKKCNGRKGKYLFLLIIPILIAAYMYRSQIVNFLLPGDPEITKSAISTFVDEMKVGKSVTDAFGAFCKVILDETNIS